MDDARDQLLEAWRTNHRITLYLLDGISPEGLACTLSKHGGRTVSRQLAHVHTNRVWHLESRRAKDLSDGLAKYTAKDEPGHDELRASLDASASAIERFLGDVWDGVGNRKAFKKGVISMLGYLIAHEAHHRGNILLTLKECGQFPDKAVRYNIWDWDRR